MVYANDVMESIGVERENAGIGFFLGLKNWVKPEIAIGAEFEHLALNWDQSQEVAGRGLLGTVTYKVESILNADLLAMLAFGGYNASYRAVEGSLENEGSNTCFGAKLALEALWPVQENVELKTRLGYRNAAVKIGIDELDFSGLELNGAINFKF